MELSDKLKPSQDFLHARGNRPRDGRAMPAAILPCYTRKIAPSFDAYDLGNTPEGLA
jgi:hypothetical protein